MVHASKNEVGSGRTNISLERSGPELSICLLLAQTCHI